MAAGAHGVARQGFTSRELVDDYDQMWGILRESFPFLNLAGKSEAELEALRVENRAFISGRVSDAAGLYLMMKQTCGALGNIAHLRPLDAQEYALFLHSLSRFQGEDSPVSNMILDPQTVASYARIGNNDIVPLLTADYSWPPFVYLPDVHAAYFRFHSFNNYAMIEQPAAIDTFLAEHPDAEHVIIDITGNPGGYGYIWMNHIVSAFNEQVHWQATSYIRMTDIIAGQYEGVDIVPIDDEASGLPSWVSELGMTHQGKLVLNLPMAEYKGAQVKQSLRRWLLVDGEVASSAEMFTRFCKDTGWATVVGTITKGDGVVAKDSPCMVRLDNTGLLMMFIVESGVNADGTPNAVRGTLPDYISKPSETPLDACVRVIRSMKANNK